jgi:hypothetical protein
MICIFDVAVFEMSSRKENMRVVKLYSEIYYVMECGLAWRLASNDDYRRSQIYCPVPLQYHYLAWIDGAIHNCQCV